MSSEHSTTPNRAGAYPRDVEATVRMAVDAVRARGDAALVELGERWDRVKLAPSDLRVPRGAIEKAPAGGEFEEAFRRAVERIRAFHEAVKPRSTTVEDAEGVRMGLRWTP